MKSAKATRPDQPTLYVDLTPEEINNLGQMTSDDLLKQAKLVKLKNLDDFYFNSKELRELSINNYFKLSLSGDGRNLVMEQINQLQLKIDLGLIIPDAAKFKYFYNGLTADITLSQLKQLYAFMMSIINSNFAIYKTHQLAIEKLLTIDDINNYNFKVNYLINQNINI